MCSQKTKEIGKYDSSAWNQHWKTFIKQVLRQFFFSHYEKVDEWLKKQKILKKLNKLK